MTNNEDYLRKLIHQTEDYSLSDEFIGRVMSSCYKYERKRNRILMIKKYSLYSISFLLMMIIIFVPGINILLLSLLSKITLIGLLEYYALTSTLMLISFYLILTERIVKFVKVRI